MTALFGTDLLMLENMLLSCLFGAAIFAVFYVTHRRLSVSKSFAFTLIMLPPISCLVALIIKHDLFLSVGMLGALSIIRYRHSMKESKNLLYVFWAVTMGLACALIQRRIAMVSFIIIMIVALAIHFVVERKNTAMLAVRTSGSAEDVENILRESTIRYEVKHTSLSDVSEILYEIKPGKGKKELFDKRLCEEIMLLKGVSSVKFIKNN